MSSPSLISHSQDYGLRVTEESFQIGDVVEIHMRTKYMFVMENKIFFSKEKGNKKYDFLDHRC